MRAKKWWKKDGRQMEEYKEWKTQKSVFFLTKWSKW